MKKIVSVLFISLLSFTWGILTVKKQIFPYQLLKSVKDVGGLTNTALNKNTHPEKLSVPVSYKDKNDEVLRNRFTSNSISYQLYPPVNSYLQLKQRIDQYIVRLDSFEYAYNNIRLLSNKMLEEDVAEVNYSYLGQEFTAYSYYRPSDHKYKDSTVNLIVPGSSNNQSQTIFFDRDSNNYQVNIDNIAIAYGDVFVFVKPNQDFLAIHNGLNKKINETAFVNYMLNKGSSYSAHYIIGTLAFSKLLKEKYQNLNLIGISQGGEAVLINAMQSQPDKAIIASGYTIIEDEILFSNQDQIIIPGIKSFYNKENVLKVIENSPTDFLFTYGLAERGLFRIEAEEQLTCSYFQKLPNVTCATHREGHVYYEPLLREFLQQD